MEYHRGKACFAERFIRTLKGKLALLQVKRPQPDTAYLAKVVRGYNQTSHSSLPNGAAPADVLRLNPPLPTDTTNMPESLLGGHESAVNSGGLERGSVVRLKLVKGQVFEKGSQMRRLGLELFAVEKVKTQRGRPLPYYSLVDMTGEPVKGLIFNLVKLKNMNI